MWLPDGSGLLVGIAEPDASARGQLWVVSYPGGVASRFTNDLTNYALCCINLTRDGKLLAAIDNTVRADLWIAPGGDSAKAERITSGEPIRNAVWTPGGKIVFEKNGEIWLSDRNGSNPARLTAAEQRASGPSVCRNGRYILFTAGEPGKSDVWRMEADGSNPTRLTNEGTAGFAECAPDGAWLDYHRFGGGNQGAWRLPIEGGTPTVVAAEASGVVGIISPDGKTVAYFRPPQASKPSELVLVPAAGGTATTSLSFPAGGGRPRWAPDGKSIAYFLTRAGVSNIWEQPVAGGPPKQITDFKSGLIFSYDWSVDGKDLLVSQGDLSTNVILISNFR
jgi:Tol biopolymer transport system component